MTPPYRLVDLATGEAASPDFDNMDTAAGRYIAVYSGPTEGSPDTRISGADLERPRDGIVDPPPIEPPPIDPPPIITPPSGGDMNDLIENEQQLRDALQTYANEQRVGSCYSRVPIQVSATINIQQQQHDGTVWGVNANHMKIEWTGPGGDDVLVYQGVLGMPNRGLFLERFSIYGNGYGGAAAGSCLKLYCPEGDPGSMYRFTLRDIMTSYAHHGIYLLGAVYEGLIDNCHAENHLSHGINMDHMNIGSPTQAIVSNIALVHPNMSRNIGGGMRQVYSTRSIFGSYIINAEGGIVAPDGIAAAVASNGENTGHMLFNMASNGLGSAIAMCEASTDGRTAQSGYGNTTVTPQPMKHGMPGNMGAMEALNHITPYYTAVDMDDISWLK